MPARTARCPLREVRPRQRREQQVEQNTESYNPPRKRKVTQYYTIFASWKVQVARIAEHFAHRQHTLFRRDRLPFRLRRRSGDRKSTRLNSSHANISYAVFCLKKKKKLNTTKSTN